MAKTTHNTLLEFKPRLHTRPPLRIEEFLALPVGASFSLTMPDETLASDGIRQGDLIRFRRTETLSCEGIAALLVEPYGLLVCYYSLTTIYGAALLRTLDRKSDLTVTLCLDVREVEIVGRAVSVKRDLRAATVKGCAR